MQWGNDRGAVGLPLHSQLGGLGQSDETPHRTTQDPKILGDGIDQTPQRTGDPDTLQYPRVGTDQQVCPDPPVKLRSEIHNFNHRVRVRVVFRGLEVRCGRMNVVYFTPRQYRGCYGSVPISGRTPAPNFLRSGAVVLGGLGVCPLIFLGLVRYGAVRCGVSSDPSG